MYTYGCMPTSFFSHKVDCQGPAIGRNYWTIPILLRLLVFSIVSCCNLHHVVYYGLRHLATYWLMRGSSRPGSPINSKFVGRFIPKQADASLALSLGNQWNAAAVPGGPGLRLSTRTPPRSLKDSSAWHRWLSPSRRFSPSDLIPLRPLSIAWCALSSRTASETCHAGLDFTLSPDITMIPFFLNPTPA